MTQSTQPTDTKCCPIHGAVDPSHRCSGNELGVSQSTDTEQRQGEPSDDQRISRLAAAVKQARGDSPDEIASSIRFLNKAAAMLRGETSMTSQPLTPEEYAAEKLQECAQCWHARGSHENAASDLGECTHYGCDCQSFTPSLAPNDQPTEARHECANHCPHDLKWMQEDGLCHFNYAVLPSVSATWKDTHCGHRCVRATAARGAGDGWVDGAEDAARAMCHMCENRESLYDPAILKNGSWLHRHRNYSDMHLTCEAQRIRDRIVAHIAAPPTTWAEKAIRIVSKLADKWTAQIQNTEKFSDNNEVPKVKVRAAVEIIAALTVASEGKGKDVE